MKAAAPSLSSYIGKMARIPTPDIYLRGFRHFIIIIIIIRSYAPFTGRFGRTSFSEMKRRGLSQALDRFLQISSKRGLPRNLKTITSAFLAWTSPICSNTAKSDGEPEPHGESLRSMTLLSRGVSHARFRMDAGAKDRR